jgi:hypothetical protein
MVVGSNLAMMYRLRKLYSIKLFTETLVSDLLELETECQPGRVMKSVQLRQINKEGFTGRQNNVSRVLNGS